MRRLMTNGAVLSLALALAACGGNTSSKNNGDTNNGDTNNGVTNNGMTNNGQPNNGMTNNGQPNNGQPNNGTTNNGTTNNGTTNNGTTNNDLCANVDCAQPPDVCEGNVAVTYSGAGTCDPATGMCDLSGVETRTDCEATGMVCELGACVANDPTPTPGSLAVTEIMFNPRAVADNDGEWIEIHNTTNRVLDLQGLKIVDDPAMPGDAFTFPAGAAIELQPGGYYVIGKSDDAATNGGATVDLAYGADINLSQNGDAIVILNASDVEIDSVAYDPDAGWPSANGQAIQFGSDYDVVNDDNADATFWCVSRTAFGDGDLGTPGAANGDCAPATVTIYEVQDPTEPNHPEEYRTVNIDGVVITAVVSPNFMWVQEPNGGKFSGLYVDPGAVDVSVFAVDDVVDLTGVYREMVIGTGATESLTGLDLLSITDTMNDMTIAPEVLETSVLAVEAEDWENVLVQVQEVGVTDIDLGNGEILLDSLIRVDDLLYGNFSMAAAECQVYESITGPLNQSSDAYKIEPRNANDIGTVAVATPATNVAASLAAGFVPENICVSVGDTVTWTNADPAIGHTVTSRLATDDDPMTNIPAMPLLDLTLPAAGTAMYTFAEPGTYHYRCRPHPNMIGRVVVPNP